MSKRLVLSVLTLGIAATAPTRVRASTEAEAVGYGGTSAGGWVCGPVGRANYGGVGARMRVAGQADHFGGRGVTGELATAVEGEASTTRCRESDSKCLESRSSPMIGTHARVGHQWEVFGFEAGATAFQGYKNEFDAMPSTAVFPDAQISIGSQSVARGVVGIGSPTVTTLRRPGAYLGADIMLGDIELQARAGAFRAGPALADDASARADVGVYIPITKPISLRLGGSVSGNEVGMGGEGSAGIRGSL